MMIKRRRRSLDRAEARASYPDGTHLDHRIRAVRADLKSLNLTIDKVEGLHMKTMERYAQSIDRLSMQKAVAEERLDRLLALKAIEEPDEGVTP